MTTQHDLADPNLPPELHVVREVFMPRRQADETGLQFARRVALEIRSSPRTELALYANVRRRVDGG